VTPISIIIPVLDEAKALAQHLPALQQWQSEGHEVIVVDGGSQDDSVAVAAEFADRIVHAPAGRASQMNAGARLAYGDLLLFLHIDTQLPEEGMRQLQQVSATEGVGWGRFDIRLSGRAPALRIIERAINWRSWASGVATGDQAIFVDRRLFMALGGYQSIPLMEDVELSKRLRKVCRPLCIRHQAVTSSRRWEQGGILKTTALMWWLRWRYFVGASPAILHRRYYPDRYRPENESRVSTRLLLFAKVPERGNVKTRIQPMLGVDGAMDLHQRLIRYTWRRLAGSQGALGIRSELWASGIGGDTFFAALKPTPYLAIQTGQDLGERMWSAASHALETAQYVVIVGADCPSVDLDYVQEAVTALKRGVPVVLGPADDGGYVLLGVRRPLIPEMFSDIPWGSDQVLKRTRSRLREQGVGWQELSPRWDVDRPEDLKRLAELPQWADSAN